MMWIFICAVIFVVSNKGYGIEGGCSPKLDVPCEFIRYTGEECSPENMLKKFPFYETSTAKFPGKPGSFEADASYKFYPKYNKWYPAVNLTFTMPQNAGKNYVKGFEVTRYESSNTISCYILDLSNITWDENSLTELDTLFWLYMWPLNPNPLPLYRFELYTLPKQENREDRFDHYLNLNIEFQGYTSSSTETARDWRSTISLSKNNNAGTINVTIATPPTKFGFTLFEYSLLDNKSGSILKSENSRQHWHVFTGVTTGSYKIWVIPVRDGSFCPCKEESVCKSCITTSTTGFFFNYTGTVPSTTTTLLPVNVPVTKPTGSEVITEKRTEKSSPGESVTLTDAYKRSTTESNEISDTKVAFAIVGSIVGLALAVIIPGIIYYSRCRNNGGEKIVRNGDHPDLDGSPVLPGKNPGYADEIASIMTFPNSIHGINNGNAEKKQLTKKPKLCLLFEDDHQYHRAVVNHFATFLQQHCQCISMCVEWQLDAPWVHEDLDQADFIVIVNSEGAYSSYMARYGQKNSSLTVNQSPMTRRMSSINSVRNNFLRDERYDNILMIYFDYTDEKFIIPDICPGFKYRLLKHFPDFLLHIHKLRRTDNLSDYDLPFDGKFNTRPIGQKLLESIAAAEQYQQQNPKWLEKRLCYDRLWSIASDESKYDSGITDDYNSCGNTPQSERSPPFHTSPQEAGLLHLLDGQSLLTVNPSDIGLSVPPRLNDSSQENAYVLNTHNTKHRPKLLPHSFVANSQNLSNHLPTPPTCSTVEDEFAFIPPDDLDDDFDVLSKTQSEQMKSIVDRYHARNNMGISLETHSDEGYENGHEARDQSEGYDRNRDLLLLKVQSGEVPFISCMNSDIVSLGGESV
ncbi:uncharacterized protein LOC132737981 [Ruditapes philippinarum]|uniref:uncharacterized protein LOC132737981 n=1 Tax=Ruditapes philippinarum TaxID=129788 RepID=UPI00295B4780|nr:uncharacterized protein LOC132737981 [Ruditapes philippinarum]